MSASAVVLNKFWWPQTVIGRFVARRTMRSAVFWALLFGAFVASKAVGYAKAYADIHERTAFAASFSSNVGLNAIFGVPHELTTVAGFTAWNTLNAMVIIGAIWALLTATRSLRGEEDAGRWELLLAGQSTALGAALNALAGLAVAVSVLYGVCAASFVLVGRVQGVDFSTGSALFFALAAVAGAAEFMAIGALASQLMPTRARAASLTAVIFGVCFLVRAMADITNTPWLLNVSPLGWIEKLQPLYNPQPQWLLPIGGLIAGVSVMTAWLAGHRDLGDSVLADRDTARPRTLLLGSPMAAAVRLTRATFIGWLAAAGFIAVFFGLLTKTAADAFTSSPNASRIIERLAAAAQTDVKTLAAKTFLGVVFLLIMMVIMLYVSSALGAVRETEGSGYLDNLLVRPVSRLRWLAGRLGLIVVVIGVMGLIASLSVWVGETSQHAGIALSVLIPAGINAMAPALFTLGVGVLAFGFVPRLTTVAAYGVLAWSFLIQMVSSGVNLNHWILDTSVFQHIALAPASDPDWSVAIKLALLGLAMCIIGGWRFTRRDLMSE